MRPALAALALAASAIALASGSGAALAETCLRAPKGVAPQGSHWYYRIDRATQHRCWYLGEKGARIAQRTATRAAPQQAEPDDDEERTPAPAAPAPAVAAPVAAAPPTVAQSLPEVPAPKITTLVTRNVSNADQTAQAPAAVKSTPPLSAPSAAPDTTTSEAPPLPPEQAQSNQQATAVAEPPAPQAAAAAVEEKGSISLGTTSTLQWALGGIALFGLLASSGFFVMTRRRRRNDVLNMQREADMLPFEHAPDISAENEPVFQPRRTLDAIRLRDLEPIRQHDDVDEILQRLARGRRAA